MKSIFLPAIIVFYVVYLVVMGLGLKEYNYFLKPLLIPSLILYVFISDNFKSKGALISALTLSTLGDVLLLFTEEGPLYFIMGLVAFLTAHLFYIYIFFNKIKTNFPKQGVGISTSLIVVYLMVLLNTMWDKLDEMKIPVVIYAVVISTMLWLAIRIYFQNYSKNALIILLGALFFVISDSTLAWNMFYQPVPSGSLIIMSTYLAAQTLLVIGLMGEKSEVKD
jgi:uncharacterized membrane protein YhhN